MREPTLSDVAAACGRLSIFPLPGVTLLPGALLPLHVFEPRYREMTADVLAGAPPVMAVAWLEPGHEADYHGRPPVRPIAGAGVIVAHERLADGRFNILLRGLARVRILREHPASRSYREVAAEVIGAEARDDEVGERLGASIGALRALCEKLAVVRPEIRDALRELLDEPQPPGVLADTVGAALLTLPVSRQALLEAVTPAARLQLVTDEVGRLAGRFATGQRN